MFAYALAKRYLCPQQVGLHCRMSKWVNLPPYSRSHSKFFFDKLLSKSCLINHVNVMGSSLIMHTKTTSYELKLTRVNQLLDYILDSITLLPPSLLEKCLRTLHGFYLSYGFLLSPHHLLRVFPLQPRQLRLRLL